MEKIAIYTTSCGLNPTFNPNIVDNAGRKYPFYLISNNDDLLQTISRSFNFNPILLNAELTGDSVISSRQAKVAKSVPHIFEQLREYDYLLYLDDKLSVQNDQIDDMVSFLRESHAPMTLRKHRTHPQHPANVLYEFAESMYQWRYRCGWDKTIAYINEEVESGYKLSAESIYATGLIVRNMQHPDTVKINEMWYNHILRCGIDCQLSFHFVAQRFNNIAALPMNL